MSKEMSELTAGQLKMMMDVVLAKYNEAPHDYRVNPEVYRNDIFPLVIASKVGVNPVGLSLAEKEGDEYGYDSCLRIFEYPIYISTRVPRDEIWAAFNPDTDKIKFERIKLYEREV